MWKTADDGQELRGDPTGLQPKWSSLIVKLHLWRVYIFYLLYIIILKPTVMLYPNLTKWFWYFHLGWWHVMCENDVPPPLKQCNAPLRGCGSRRYVKSRWCRHWLLMLPGIHSSMHKYMKNNFPEVWCYIVTVAPAENQKVIEHKVHNKVKHISSVCKYFQQTWLFFVSTTRNKYISFPKQINIFITKKVSGPIQNLVEHHIK